MSSDQGVSMLRILLQTSGHCPAVEFRGVPFVNRPRRRVLGAEPHHLTLQQECAASRRPVRRHQMLSEWK